MNPRIQLVALAVLLAAALPLLPRVAAAGSDEDPRELRAAQPAPEPQRQPRATLPTGGDGAQPVWFVPQDNANNATVIFLYSTRTDDVTVPLRGYSYNGVLVYSLNIDVAAGSFVRLVSDSVVTAPPPSWATHPSGNPDATTAIVTNFTDFTYYARLLLPAGVHVDGYIEWNPGTGVVDPNAPTARVPLHFSVGTAP
jgi:hypothetical protein